FRRTFGMIACRLGVAAYLSTTFTNEGGEGMRQVLYGIAVARLGFALVVTLPHAAWSYASFQGIPYVSDAEPFCTGCHTSVDASYHPELPAEVSQGWVYTTKHYKALEEGTFPGYKTLEPDKRKELLEQARKID